MNRLNKLSLPFLAFTMYFACPTAAWAHVGVGGTADFVSGFLHPLGGLDHLLAMLGVGIWAAQHGGKALWTLPLAFLFVMIFGWALGSAGVALPFAERGIAASVFLLGVLIAAAVRLPLIASACLVGCFAIFHGHAHGAEMPIAAGGFSYLVGFAFTTLSLVAIGLIIGVGSRRFTFQLPVRASGALMFMIGLYLLSNY